MSNVSLIIIVSLSGVICGLIFIACFVHILLKFMFDNKEIARLTQDYKTNDRPESHIFEKQTIGLSKIRYRNCVTVCISLEGLYLSINGFRSRNQRVLIPWNQIKNVEKTSLYGVEAFALMIGRFPYITVKVYPSLFSKMRPYLKKYY